MPINIVETGEQNFFSDHIPESYSQLKELFINFESSETFASYFDDNDKTRYIAVLVKQIEDGKTEQEIIHFFFRTEESFDAEEKAINKYKKYWGELHATKYSAEISNNIDTMIKAGVVYMDASMYAAKTTASLLFARQLEEQGYKIFYGIADVLGVDKITARALNEERNATSYPHNKNVFLQAISAFEGNKKCLVLDEFSFLSSQVVTELIDWCLEQNVLLVLAGLNTTSNGDSLIASELRQKLESTQAYRFECKSFTADQIDFDDNQVPEPKGTHTRRFIQFTKEPKHFIADLDFADEVIAKENPYVIYRTTDKSIREIINESGYEPEKVVHIQNISKKRADHHDYMRENFAA